MPTLRKGILIMKCPNCGYDNAKLDGDAYFCPMCFSRFQPKVAEQKSINNTEAPRAENKESVTASVYQENVKGVAMIQWSVGNSLFSGSGFIATSDGLVVTNGHVVYHDEKKCFTKKVKLIIDNKEYTGTVINANVPDDTSQDVAIIKIDDNNRFRPLRIGNSDRVVPGDDAIALGNPLGYGLAVSKGIISDRRIFSEDSKYPVLISDVAINGGNSGGPLFNDKGEVIAICVASYTRAEQGMNIFIPINTVIEIVRNWGYMLGR